MMDDDIDIEEHDVLEDPRVRDMFPDINKLKNEINSIEDEETTPLSETMPIKQEELPNLIIKTEPYHDIDMEDPMHEPAEEPFDEPSDELDGDPLTSCSYFEMNGNKIILGSKPSPHINNNIDLNAFVLLKDWGPHLAKSSSFCTPCGTLFSTPNCLDAHETSVHSLLVALSRNKAIKSTAKLNIPINPDLKSHNTDIRYCNHCNTTFPDSVALIKHSYEIIFKKKHKHLSQSIVKYRCSRCCIILKTYHAARDHKLLHHPNSSNRILKKVLCKPMRKPQPSLARHREPVKVTKPKIVDRSNLSGDVQEAVPCNMLFLCTTCQVHYLSCYAMGHHWSRCNGDAPYVTCHCKRKFRPQDLQHHKKQHQLTEKFRISKSVKGLYLKVLSRCPYCNVCFDELLFKSHYLQGCGKVASEECKVCHLKIHEGRFKGHVAKHRVYKTSQFIIVDYPKLNPDGSIQKAFLQEAKLETLKNHATKSIAAPNASIKSQSNNRIDMFFCVHCNCCFKQYVNIRRPVHQTKKCIEGNKAICQQCGLLFTLNSKPVHDELHKSKKLTVHDFNFYCESSEQRVLPIIPEYPKCPICSVHFVSTLRCENHNCTKELKKSEICSICNKIYSKTAYKLHEEFHVYYKREDTTNIPELMEKYESLEKIWNIMYRCVDCEIATDQYDKAIEHSQMHYIHEHEIETRQCEICSIDLDEECFDRHMDLHTQNTMLNNRNNLRILNYIHTDLLADKWMQLFDDLSKNQIDLIISQSYHKIRDVKLHIKQNGKPELTLYVCHSCHTCVDETKIHRHISSVCKPHRLFCDICAISFDSYTNYRKHTRFHENVKYEDIRFIHFNLKEDQEINNALRKHNDKNNKRYSLSHVKYQPTSRSDDTEASERKVNEGEPSGSSDKDTGGNYSDQEALESDHIDDIKTKSKYIVYKCKDCGSCILVESNVKSHRCTTDREKQFCKICKQYFPRRVTYHHNLRHRTQIDFHYRNIHVETFKSFYPRPVAAVDTEPYTGPIAEPTAKLYKCKCGLHFTSKFVVEKHSIICSPSLDISKEKCSKCGKLFPTNLLVTHLCKHHNRNMKIVVEDYIAGDEEAKSDVTTKSEETPVDIDKEATKPDIKLYKCVDCNVCFTTHQSCYEHTIDHVPFDSKFYIECKLCGFQFNVGCFAQHITLHHTTEFNINRVYMKEFYPSEGTKEPPQIKCRLVNDKLQSLLVSSSNLVCSSNSEAMEQDG